MGTEWDQIALKSMQQIQTRQIVNATPVQEAAMLEQALSLCTRCLSYDFIGTNPDESSEDVGTIQVCVGGGVCFLHYIASPSPTA